MILNHLIDGLKENQYYAQGEKNYAFVELFSSSNPTQTHPTQLWTMAPLNGNWCNTSSMSIYLKMQQCPTHHLCLHCVGQGHITIKCCHQSICQVKIAKVDLASPIISSHSRNMKRLAPFNMFEFDEVLSESPTHHLWSHCVGQAPITIKCRHQSICQVKTTKVDLASPIISSRSCNMKRLAPFNMFEFDEVLDKSSTKV